MKREPVVSPGRTPGEDAGPVRSVSRVGRIITTLAEHSYPMGIAELSRRVQLSPGSVHRLIVTLVSLGWVEQNTRTAKYRLGTRILGIGSIGLVANPVIESGKTFLARLAEWTGHDALLSTLVGMRTVHLARVAGTHSAVAEFEAGRSQPAYATADGKLLLAHLPEEERRYLYEVEGMHRYSPNTIIDPAELERELAKVREQGYAVDDRERFEHGLGVAVPVLGPDHHPILALLCAGELDPGQLPTLVKRMLSLAHEMSDQLSVVGDMPGPRVPRRVQSP